MSLSILNVGEGDTKITFDKDKPGELERAKRVVLDMLRLGYAIMVKVGEAWQRATDFDPATCEYVVSDTPPEEAAAAAPAKRPRGRPRRVPGTSRAVGIARSAGGMSDAVDSIERQNLERFDTCAEARNTLRKIAERAGEWAGIPMPFDDIDLIVDPKYPAAQVFQKVRQIEDNGVRIRNRWYSDQKRLWATIAQDKDGKIFGGYERGPVHHFSLDIHGMGTSDAWGIEQEHNALQLLAELIRHVHFKRYLLTGMFIERSQRSGLVYVFRRLKPTVVLRSDEASGAVRILACLCAHPIAYYSGTWAGAMCPTDDVIAHLMMMRGDEKLYWRRCNQHAAHHVEAGL